MSRILWGWEIRVFSLEGSSGRLCDGVSRREILRAGGLGLLGLSAAGLDRLQAASVKPRVGKAKSCILLFLIGGPPQHSTWDPKPSASEEIRGAFGPVATSVPGTQFCELMPKTASLADRIAVLRSVVTNDNAHSSSGYAMLTGRPHQPLNFENANPGAPNDWPTLGAVVQYLHQGQRELPPSIRLPHHIFNTDQSVWPGQDSGFLGPAADPWLFRCEPASSNSNVPDFQLPDEVPIARFNARRSLLKQLDHRMQRLEETPNFEQLYQQNQQAFNLLTSSRSFQACDLTRETDSARDRYGRHQFGQSVLMARRLVEAGVTLVQVNWFRGPDEPSDAPCWDSHSNETQRLKNNLVPPFDQAYSALLTDLEDRGQLDETLVVCLSEFGRTPKFNPRAGRDHWGHCFSVSLAGGGIQGGVVHGISDKHAAYPVEGVVHPEDITATIFHCLGYGPETEIRDPLDRPLAISQGDVIRSILS